MTEQPKRAVLRNRDDDLPLIKPDVRRQPRTTAPTKPAPVTVGTGKFQRELPEPTMNELIIEDAATRLNKRGRRKGTTSVQFTEAHLYKAVAERLGITRYARNPRREVEALQKTLALLTWEVGLVLEDIDTFGDTTTESKK